MGKYVACSECFSDHGLKLVAEELGVESNEKCQQCGSSNGKKLTKKMSLDLAHTFFVRGTVSRMDFGEAPVIEMNEYHYKKSDIHVCHNLKTDMEILENATSFGFFYYGPRLWMLGENEPLKMLQTKNRKTIIDEIIRLYPIKIVSQNDIFYRIRINPSKPEEEMEYDSPPVELETDGRFDSKELKVMYASQDIELCIHECRATVYDDIYMATMKPGRNLRLIDLTEVIQDNSTEFESLDIALNMLFNAGKYSYYITRDMAKIFYLNNIDGIIYPSYYSSIRTGSERLQTVYGLSIRFLEPLKDYVKSQIMHNIAIFGNPIKEGKMEVKNINRVFINSIKYKLRYGPVDYQYNVDDGYV